MTKRYLLIIALLLIYAVVFAQQTTQRVFDGGESNLDKGLNTALPPGVLKPGQTRVCDNALIRDGAVVQRQGYDLLYEFREADMEHRGIRGAWEYYNASTKETQYIYVVHDELFVQRNDSLIRMAVDRHRHRSVNIPSGDSVVTFFTAWNPREELWPESGDRWRLYIYTQYGGDTIKYDVYRFHGDNKLMIEGTAAANSLLQQNWDLVPIVDTTHPIDFTTFEQLCIISDGLEPALKWNGYSFDTKHFYVDSATILAATFVGQTYIKLELDDDQLMASGVPLEDYATYHYAVFVWDSIYERARWYPIVSLGGDPAQDELHVFGDRYDYNALSAGTKIYIVPGANELFSTDTDTILTGIVDSMVQYDSIPGGVEGINILTFYGDVTLPLNQDSIDVDLPGNYLSVDSFQVLLQDQSALYWYPGNILRVVKKIDKNTFRIVRPHWLPQREKSWNWITVGVPDAEVDRDSLRYWQWGAGNTGVSGAEQVVVDPDYYDDVDSFGVITTAAEAGQNFDLSYAVRDNDSSFTYNSVGYCHQDFKWMTVGAPATAADANSLSDTFTVQYGVDTIFDKDLTKTVYLETLLENGDYGVVISRMDSLSLFNIDSLRRRLWIDAQGYDKFIVKRSDPFVNRDFIFSWVVVDYNTATPGEIKYTLVYDQDELTTKTYRTKWEYEPGPYIFRIIDGPGSESDWWGNGVPCDLQTDFSDSMCIRVLAPNFDYDSSAISLLPPDSSTYAVLRLYHYPPSRFTFEKSSMIYFGGVPSNPNIIYESEVNDPYTIWTDNYIDVASGDGDETQNVSDHHGQLWWYKKNLRYSITGDIINNWTPRLTNYDYGLWSPGFLVSYAGLDYGVTREGVFECSGGSARIISQDVEAFFTDSLNTSAYDAIRGVIHKGNLLVSIPTGLSTVPNKVLVYNLQNKVWTTWSMSAGDFVRRKAPGSLDSLMICASDSIQVFSYEADPDDYGDDVSLVVRTDFHSFGSETLLKAVENIGIIADLSEDDSLIVRLYEDDFLSATWTDTIVFSEIAGQWTDTTLNTPPRARSVYVAVEFETLSADTCLIKTYNLRVKPGKKTGAR